MREFHPVANLFPLMDGKRFEELREDIRANGLRDPLVIHADGMIIDGRNRARACDELGIEPACRQWDGNGSILAFVYSVNLYRRHLNAKQRGMIAARLVTTEQGNNRFTIDKSRDVSIAETADMFSVSKPTVQRAITVIAHADPETIANLERGQGSLREAAANAARANRARRAPGEPKRTHQQKIADRAKDIEHLRELAAEGYSSRQMTKVLRRSEEWCRAMMRKEKIECRGDIYIRGTRRMKADRVMEAVVYAAENITTGADLIDFDEINPESLKPWIDRLRAAVKVLTAFIRHCETHSKGQTNAKQGSSNRADKQAVPGSDSGDADSNGRRYATAH